MKRKTFDSVLSLGGVVLTVVLLIAGGLLMWGYTFANGQVHNQLAMQQISFPTQAQLAQAKAGSEVTPAMVPYLEPYAGQPVLTGPQAETYADHFIANHLAAMPYGGVYSQVSAASRANPNDATLKAEVQTVFQGTTLRGLLLEAYAFGKFGQIALIASICSFALAGVMLLLSFLGFVHLRRVRPEEEIFTSDHPIRELVGIH
ncbi:MAG TPA: hypothetical protein VGR90_03435 [Acidimicrobiales bacterium]|nr:hypothetical protein [Acidimicrobiales bacterium]